MKLSVCIPVYNFDVRNLVEDLNREINKKELDAEIILIDDASDETFTNINKELLDKVQNFIFLEKNVGRSKIRNFFLNYSRGEYFLFLDCDGKIIEENFLKKYISFLNENPDVVYGGRVVSEIPPEKKYILRWKFAVERENLPISMRLQKPYLSFQTNNFIIKKEIFQKITFDPGFEKYGYEDLLFAMDLKSEHIKIQHIDNPIFNNDLESNDVYLEKVKESVENLSRMINIHPLKLRISEIKLVKAYTFLQNLHLQSIFLTFFGLFEERIKKNLLSDNPKITYLDFYKLGLLLNLKNLKNLKKENKTI